MEERLTTDQAVAGSSPATVAFFCLFCFRVSFSIPYTILVSFQSKKNIGALMV